MGGRCDTALRGILFFFLFLVFFTGARKHFQESGTRYGSKGHVLSLVINPFNPTKVFSSAVG